MSELISPVQPIPPVSSGFRTVERPGHNGIDLAIPTGTVIQAPAAGVVSLVADEPSGAGLHINLDHDNGFHTRHFHLSGFLVSHGDRVTQGQTVALSGATGVVTGPHLHYEVHRPKGTPVDPAPYLTLWSPSPPPPPVPSVPTLEGEQMAEFVVDGIQHVVYVTDQGDMIQTVFDPGSPGVDANGWRSQVVASGCKPGADVAVNVSYKGSRHYFALAMDGRHLQHVSVILDASSGHTPGQVIVQQTP